MKINIEQRSTEQPVYHALSDLVGLYVEVVE